MKNLDYKGVQVKPQNILFASTSEQDYEMSRIILLETDDYKYVILEGGHCSCFGFEDTEWTAIEYEESELKLLPLDYGIENADLKAFIKRYF